ncbi:hypothetical protein A5788_03115 [Gordonia sp. 852002-50816_SCH5313054-c]|nr:hypothetical protein A5785_10435 [Gordonia sp. 852002-50395_SCH5434458]OBC09797.1 hypothetical protein A5786_06190 [Gordonia sp. 852002-50816_SCH5313054-a]OBC17905.1 hypothetical protein A5788_03115 [Gordonia sp. 852002-50816_SCH5313054-c]
MSCHTFLTSATERNGTVVRPRTQTENVDVARIALPLVALILVLTLGACSNGGDSDAPHHIRWGAYLPDLKGSDVDSDAGVVGVTTLADRPLDLILTFSGLREPVPNADLARIAETGAVPIVSIEPWNPSGGVNQPDYRLSRIADGAFDSDLRRWATGLKEFGKPVIVRFAHEMNGDWYPWGMHVNGNTPQSYIDAWRHVRSILTSIDPHNISMVWAPMAAISGIPGFDAAYPGDDEVDYLGIDGYNWGNDGKHGWASPEFIFSDAFVSLRRLGDKPILVTEVASADDPDPTRKATWIHDFVSLVSREPDVDGFVWFQANKERDWRFNSNPQSEKAFRSALDAVPAT